MGDSLGVLFVEDSDADLSLALRELECDGLEFTWQIAGTEPELRRVLANFRPDILLCGCQISGNTGWATIDLLRSLCPVTPLLLLSGTIDEDIAISALKRGGTDYLLKSNLRRLGPAVWRAVGDARERKRVQELEDSHRRLTEILDASADMVVTSDAEGRISFVNDSACRLLGESRQELLHTELNAVRSAPNRPGPRQDVMQAATQTGSWCGELLIEARDGTLIATSQVVIAHKDRDGNVRQFSTIAHDLRDRKAFEAKIHQLVHFDTLTGLPNLSHMDDLVRRSIGRAHRNNHVIALVILNLDRFRLVDEGYGRAVGDHVLKDITAALTASVRERNVVARVGPDEFLVILPELADPLQAAGIVQRLLDSIAAPRSLGGRDLRITASAGIAIYPNDGGDFETLLRHASAAMHETKTRSNGSLKFHSGDVERRAQRRLHLETGLRKAIQNHELSVHYQPQFELRSGRACGVEALARWFRPAGRTIAPSVFIPLAEQTGLICALGSWVLEQACTTVASWGHPGEHLPTLCVNVSTQQISDEFAASIARVTKLTGFPPTRLELEITESMLIENADLALRCLAQCRQLGVRIAVDDFGTGYSSLSYLSRLPVDRLKVDQSLIQSMTSKPKDAAIVRALISLGQELGFTVIAEGVETESQFQMLHDLGCQQVQGYLLSPPVCEGDARELLLKRWGNRVAAIPRAARMPTASLHAS